MGSRRIVDYSEVRSEGGVNVLASGVRSAIVNGWQPFGNVYKIESGANLPAQYVQPVVKYQDCDCIAGGRL